MRLGIKGKQVLGVTSIVGAAVVALSLLHLSRLARVSVDESRARAELLSHAIFQRARDLVVDDADPFRVVRGDPGLRSILESSLYSKNVTYAAIVDTKGIAVAHADPMLEGVSLPPGGDLSTLVNRAGLAQLAAIYSTQGQNLEHRESLLLRDREIGSIRIGVSTLLLRDDLQAALRPAILVALGALAVAVVVATLLSQLLLRPIHVLKSGLTRLGRGEFGVKLELNQQDEFGDLGAFFNEVSQQLSAGRATGALLDPAAQQQQAMRYAQKVMALGRLTAGVAHEVKNPLNAMMIHLELLRQQIGSRQSASRRFASQQSGAVAIAEPPQALEHVDVIAKEIRRLDEVVQGFLRFTRPEELKLQPVALRALFDEIVPLVRPEADRVGVALDVDCRVEAVQGDRPMLRQAFLNLALNACQAMPHGGTLTIRCQAISGHRAAIEFVDTGVGIAPEHLQRIFDLYFTTKEKGSGIGLSMVYRTVQMHDGEIEVQSTPGAGTTFRILLPRA